MQKYAETLCATKWQTNLTMSLLQDIPTFHGWDTTKPEDWFSDIEMAADILKEQLSFFSFTEHSLIVIDKLSSSLSSSSGLRTTKQQCPYMGC